MGILEGALTAFSLIMQFVPAGTKAYAIASEGAEAIKLMQAQGRNPTAAEFEAELTAIAEERARLHSDDV